MACYLEKIRREKGMTQAELSEKSGVSRQTIITIEADKTHIVSSKTLLALAKALEVPVQQIFYTSDDQ